ncbi:MAG: sigma-70 family RNA polymerase sigma factor [Bacteroidia bacterium]|nr:sigma-70 family RNA polymerase sigma factor [Bacteroidia bacterium]
MASYHISESQLIKEQKWIEASQKDPGAFGEIYNFYYNRIFLFIFKRVEEEDEAVDITAQTFLKALTNIGKFSFQGVPFAAWLYRIALNEVNMYYRKDKSQLTESVGKVQIAEMLEETDAIVSEDMVKQLSTILQKLDPDDMQLISLRFFEGMPFKEVADILGITENNAKVKTYRILDKMKKQFRRTEG